MKIWRNELPQLNNAVVTIGSFDGVHAGHQSILTRVVELATLHNTESVVVTFEPHPRLVVFPGDPAVRLITDIDEKCRLLAAACIQNIVLVRFDAAFAEQSPDEYIQNFLIKHFHPSHIVIGYDHHFGKNRQGNITLLEKYTSKFNFKIQEINKQTIDDIAISSTKIRNFIEEGNIKAANQLLGRRFALTGTVVKGAQVGRTIGYPTANIALHSTHSLRPNDGIYAAVAYIDEYDAENVQLLAENGLQIAKRGRVCSLYIGKRPTLNGDTTSIEAYIFDFDDDIYDKKIRIELVDKIRNDKKLADLESLKKQISLDNKAVLEAFLQ